MKKLIPTYCWVPIAVTVILNMLTYYGTRIFFPNRSYVNVLTAVDTLIPLVPGMIFIYVGAFATWALGIVLVVQEPKERCLTALTAEQIAKAMSLLIFIFLPTNMVRPDVDPSASFASWLLHLIYSIDAPDNLFPSLHCVENWIIFRVLLGSRRVKPWVKSFFGVYALLVFAAVLLVKQHLFLDVVGAVVVVELALLAANHFKAGRIYERLDPSIRKNR